ncbi:PR domain zinc finger protein 15 [Echinococcus granulosus]|uniref:Zinc finger C2H2 type n=1 Tax=Echinococcus granulosus TaxID=6210 RepID=A0A068WJ79_ECHGR|nr:PR domain zinc finger protein 15 [Echinococcus granulosus]CDS20155.1 zinc finger C2H2 type [Echinococcus granulosus]
MQTSSSLKSNNESCEAEDDKVLSICTICGDTFPMISLLHAHVNAKHNVDDTGMVSAFDCSFVARSPTRSSAGPEAIDPKHVCTHCGEGFFKKSDLKEHIVAVHRNLKTHICDQCRKGFTTPSYLRLHVLTVHEGVKAYSCPLCSKRYTQKHSLKKHISSRHGSDSTKNTATSNKEPHQSMQVKPSLSAMSSSTTVSSAALKKSFSPLPHCIFLYNTRFLQLLLSLIKLKNIICDLLGTDPVPLLTISSFPL